MQIMRRIGFMVRSTDRINPYGVPVMWGDQ